MEFSDRYSPHSQSDIEYAYLQVNYPLKTHFHQFFERFSQNLVMRKIAGMREFFEYCTH